MTEIGEIRALVDGQKGFLNNGLRELKGLQTRLDLHPSPTLIFYLVMNVCLRKTLIVEEIVFV